MIRRILSRTLGLLACAAMVLAPVTVQAETIRPVKQVSRGGTNMGCCCCKPGASAKHACGCCPAKAPTPDSSRSDQSAPKGCCDSDGCHCNAGLCGGGVSAALPCTGVSFAIDTAGAQLRIAEPDDTGAARQTDVFHPPRI